jgi:protein-S-isoprenylcysteine O-methyltransferase Ste14
MTLAPSSQPQTQQQDPGWLVRAGGRLFTWRTSLPLPIALALLLIPSAYPPWSFVWPGLALVAAGECIRLWGVRQIGAISRTRSDRLGPLVATGPFALVRNPLYLGNITLWTGFSLCAALPWMAPLVVLLLALVYHAIVRWEEQLLESRLGASYRAYMASVPRWIPRINRRGSRPLSRPSQPGFSWRDTLFSERGTLIAIAAGFALLSAKYAVLR